jgi:hypothetical protein
MTKATTQTMKNALLASAFAALMVAPVLAQSSGQASTPATPAATRSTMEVFNKALAHPASRQLYAFDFADQMDGASPSFTRGRIDPSQPKNSRVTIYEATGKDWNAAEAKKRYERNAKGDIWCDNLSYGADGPVTEKPGAAGTRVFTFTPVPKPNAKDDERELYRKLSAEMVVDAATGYIKVFSARLTKAWKPVFIAKVDTVQLRGECAIAPNGRLYTVKLDTTLNGNVLGLGQSQSVKRVITNLAPVGAP